MKCDHPRCAATVLIVALVSGVATSASSAQSQHSTERTPATAVAEPGGLHDFDFLVGDWHVHHRVKPAANQPWVDYEGTCTTRLLMGGAANVEDHTIIRPAGITRAVGVRAYDPKTQEWATWWIDGRYPHLALDPPVKGHFEQGIGTFYSDSMLNGKLVRTRFIWSHITKVSGRWEQALSYDAGKTWETNWVMEFERIS